MKFSSKLPRQASAQTAGRQGLPEQTLPVLDNRPEVVVQRQVQEMAMNSTRTVAQRQAFAEALGDGNSNPKPNNTGMPDTLKTGLESYSGMDLSDVKVHYNSSRPAQLQALAYAQGSEIHLGPGQEKHLPHEGWHVVQQRQGRVKPTLQTKGGVYINDNDGLENEADVMGDRAMNITGYEKHHEPYDLDSSNFQNGAIQLVKGLNKGDVVSVTDPDTKEVSQGMIVGVTETKYSVIINNVKREIDEKNVAPAPLLVSGKAASVGAAAATPASPVATAAPASALPLNTPLVSSADDKKQGQPSSSPPVGEVGASAAAGNPINTAAAVGAARPIASASGGVDLKALNSAMVASADMKEDAKKSTWGFFMADEYRTTSEETEDGTEIGCEIALSFYPYANFNIVKKPIGLIQTVTPQLNEKFDPSQEDDLTAKEEDRPKTLEHLLSRKNRKGFNTVIDRDDSGKDKLRNPVYGSISNVLDDNKLGDGNSLGVLHGIWPAIMTPARLWDGPTRYRKDGRQSMEFETAAVLLVPPFTYLGSVKWGWTKEAGAKECELIPLKIADTGDPSPAFIEAARVWNETKKNGMDLLKIPIPGDQKNSSNAKVKAPEGCCYITTACVEYMGLNDDCEELTLLRQFRDGYLLEKPNGRALVEVYYRYSPQIVSAIRMNENYDEILKRLYDIIRQCVLAIKRGDNELAFQTYCEMVMRLKDIFIPEHDEIEIEIKTLSEVTIPGKRIKEAE